MDETFEEWVQNDAQQPCIKNWAKELIELGTSWDSFRREDSAIVQDLVDAGNIPLLASRDIVKLAKEEIERCNAPMAIFWDLENMPIPHHSSGRDVSTRLKSILAPYGNLVQFRGYASIGLNLIPQQKRSDLQLSGCHLVDCPHNGRKEVADKMIIVDAMQFAFTNPTGATLCFITGDVDYAYLLAVLQRPSWRTIVISRGTMSSMLHVNCDMRMRWETDILQLRPSSSTNRSDRSTATGTTAPVKSDSSSRSGEDAIAKSSSGSEEEVGVPGVKSGVPSTQAQDSRSEAYAIEYHAAGQNGAEVRANPSTENKTRTTPENAQLTSHHRRFEALNPMEEWTDDVELLRSLLKENGNSAFTCNIIRVLRTTNPARFKNRISVRKFISRAVEAGVILETGEGYDTTLSLPSTPVQQKELLPLSKKIPLEMLKEVPEKVVATSQRRPYILFAPRYCLPPAAPRSIKYAYVQRSHHDRWLILMFIHLADAQRAVEELPHISGCVLVDWRNCQSLEIGEPCGKCCRCQEDLLESEIIYKVSGNSTPTTTRTNKAEIAYCSDCYSWTNSAEKGCAVDRVVNLLTMMAEHDDIYVARKFLKKQLYQRYTGVCTTHKHAELWIEAAIQFGKVSPFKKDGQRKLYVCLTCNLELASSPHPPEEMKTNKEEKHIEDYLNASTTWVSRKALNESLTENFARMNTPFMRAKVFHNAYLTRKFSISRGPFGQTVGLTEQEAQESLEMMNKAMREDLEWNLKGNGDSDDNLCIPLEAKEEAEEQHERSVAATNTTRDQEVVQPDADCEENHQTQADDISEWDGESIDSADIDAHVLSRTSPDVSSL